MTHAQQEATRALLKAEYAFLESYGWSRVLPGGRVRHANAPDTRPDYSVRDAMVMTRGEPLRFSMWRASV